MRKVYPAIIHMENDGLWISFPDLEGCHSDGEDIDELMMNAEEALGLYLATIIESGESVPHATLLEEVKTKARESKTYVSVDVDEYHRDMKAVKKTVSIPGWQAKAANQRQLSLSKVLQQALNTTLGL